jgi:hypothetical protein
MKAQRKEIWVILFFSGIYCVLLVLAVFIVCYWPETLVQRFP